MNHLVILLLLAASPAPPAGAPFDAADNASMEADQRKPRDLFLEASRSDPDPKRRDQAILRAARLDWYVFHDAPAACSLLGGLAKGPEASAALAERSRLETELTRDFGAARKAARDATTAAKKASDRDEALTRLGAATVEEARSHRLAGRCPADRQSLGEAVASLSAAIEGSGLTLERSRLLLDASLLAGDEKSARKAWGWYDAELPSLVPADVHDPRATGLALARAKLFDEAELVLRNPCAPLVAKDDAPVLDVLRYAAFTRRVHAIAGEHFRMVASGVDDAKEFHPALGAEGLALWKALSPPPKDAAFSLEAVRRELDERFGAVVTVGDTEGIPDILYGHRVADETREVEQYGRKAMLRFIQLDGMIAGGYATWVTHGRHGTGGWVGNGVVYQVRPMYVEGPLRLWRQLTDPEAKALAQDEIRAESLRDRERVKGDEVAALRGLALRLADEYAEALKQRLEKRGLTGDALRDEFLRTVRLDTDASSIWAHEGRHAIDKAMGIHDSEELEFRAKLSEVQFAPGPKGSLGSILSPVGGSSAHGKANERVLRGIVAWMDAHAAEISGFEPEVARLAQLDRLTGDQLRAACRSLDPLAKNLRGAHVEGR